MGKEQEAEGLAELSPDDREQRLRKLRQRTLGNVEFIGELFKRKMVGLEEVRLSVDKLTRECQDDTDKIQPLCKLLEGVGKAIETQSKESLDGWFRDIDGVLANAALSSRYRFMLLDLIDLRGNGWVPRRAASGPKTLEDVQKEVDKENRYTEKKKDGKEGDGKAAKKGGKDKKGGRKEARKEPEDDGWSQVTAEKQKGKPQQQQGGKKGERQKAAKEEAAPPPSPGKAGAAAGKPAPAAPSKGIPGGRGGFAALMGDDEEEDDEEDKEVRRPAGASPACTRAFWVRGPDLSRALCRRRTRRRRRRRRKRRLCPRPPNLRPPLLSTCARSRSRCARARTRAVSAQGRTAGRLPALGPARGHRLTARCCGTGGRGGGGGGGGRGRGAERGGGGQGGVDPGGVPLQPRRGGGGRVPKGAAREQGGAARAAQ